MSRLDYGPNEKRRIDSWKEIAAFFGRDERTVKRWEQSRSLPVHRVPGAGKSGVFAYADELKEWLHSTQQEKSNPDIPGSGSLSAEGPRGPDLEMTAEVTGAIPGSGASSSPAALLERLPEAPASCPTPLDSDALPGDPGSVSVANLAPPAFAASSPNPPPAVPPKQMATPRSSIIRASVLEMPRSGAYANRVDDRRDPLASVPHLASPQHPAHLHDPRTRQGSVADRRPVNNSGIRDARGRRRFWIGASAVTAGALALAIWQQVRSHAALAPAAQPPKLVTVHDPLAEDYYLKGRYYWNRRTADSLNQAVDAFTQAIVHDPADAEAYAGLADTYDLMPEYTSMPQSEAYTRAIAAASKAVSLDDSLSEAHCALAFGLFYGNWEIVRALSEYRRAIQLNPRDVEAHHWYATSLMSIGRNQEALAEIERARELDPASKSIMADRALLLYFMGDRQQATSDLTELERTDPEFLSPPHYLASVFLNEGDYPAYLNQIKRSAAISKNPDEAAFASSAARGFAHGQRRGMLEEMQRIQKKAFDNGQSTGFDLASTSAMLGDKEATLVYLRSAIAARDDRILGFREGPFQQLMGADPRLQQLIAQVRSRIQGAPGEVGQTKTQ